VENPAFAIGAGRGAATALAGEKTWAVPNRAGSLTLYGITLYGTYDVGVGYVTHSTYALIRCLSNSREKPAAGDDDTVAGWIAFEASVSVDIPDSAAGDRDGNDTGCRK
jgi:hypothetical protein